MIDIWGEPRHQRQFEQMVHNHTVWESIYNALVLRCPSVRELGDWSKCKDRLDYLRKKYREVIKHNKKSGADPITCPFYEELDAVLGCRPMNNPGQNRMDNGGSSDDEESDCGSSENTTTQNSSVEVDTEVDINNSSPGSSSKSTPLQTPKHAEPKPSERRRRKGRKTQIMEALDKSLDRLIKHESTHDYDRERFEWEKEMERNKMELEKKRLDFEIKRMEADEKRAEENRALMLQVVQCLRPPPHHLPFLAPSNYYPYTPHPPRQPAESMDFPSTAPGPPAPAAHQVHFYDDPSQ